MSEGKLQIDHDVPFPDSGRGHKRTPLTAALDTMKVGDSIVIPKAERSKAISAANYRGKKVSTRGITPELIRVWITEEKK